MSIALSICGNPISGEGFGPLIRVGVFPAGEGEKLDRQSRVQENPSYIIERRKDYILYILNSSAVTPCDSARSGRLVIALAIPKNKRLKDKSPYDVLKAVSEKFEREYLNGSAYKKVDTYNQGSFKSLLEVYDLEECKPVSDSMAGSDVGIVRVENEEQMRKLFADSQYPEFCKYSSIEIGYNCVSSSDLKIRIPRPKEYKVYLNNSLTSRKTLIEIEDSYCSKGEMSLKDSEYETYENSHVEFTLGELLSAEGCTLFGGRVKLDAENNRIDCHVNPQPKEFRLTPSIDGDKDGIAVIKKALNKKVKISFMGNDISENFINGETVVAAGREIERSPRLDIDEIEEYKLSIKVVNREKLVLGITKKPEYIEHSYKTEIKVSIDDKKVIIRAIKEGDIKISLDDKDISKYFDETSAVKFKGTAPKLRVTPEKYLKKYRLSIEKDDVKEAFILNVKKDVFIQPTNRPERFPAGSDDDRKQPSAKGITLKVMHGGFIFNLRRIELKPEHSNNPFLSQDIDFEFNRISRKYQAEVLLDKSWEGKKVVMKLYGDGKMLDAEDYLYIESPEMSVDVSTGWEVKDVPSSRKIVPLIVGAVLGVIILCIGSFLLGSLIYPNLLDSTSTNVECLKCKDFRDQISGLEKTLGEKDNEINSLKEKIEKKSADAAKASLNPDTVGKTQIQEPVPTSGKEVGAKSPSIEEQALVYVNKALQEFKDGKPCNSFDVLKETSLWKRKLTKKQKDAVEGIFYVSMNNIKNSSTKSLRVKNILKEKDSFKSLEEVIETDEEIKSATSK